MTTNIPAIVFTPTGPVVPTEEAVLAGVWADLQAAFGGNLNESLATPQGQLATSLAACVSAVYDQFLEFVNQTDPAVADGRMQDAIGRLYYLERLPALPTTVTAICVGAAGTLIPVGSLAKATDGTIFQSAADATIPLSGTINITFTAIDTGPIPCPAGTLNSIYRSVAGWDTITNASDGTLGRDVESRSEFETRRAASVVSNAIGIVPSIRAAVLAAGGVADAYVVENSTASSQTIGGVSVAARSVYVCASGGADAAVAKAIWSKKPPGCGTVGGTTVSVADDVSGYSAPLPTYSIKFDRPTSLPLYLAVSIANGADVPSDAVTQIQAAILSAAAGEDGGQALKIGTTTYALRFASAIAALGSWARLISIAIGTSASPTGFSVGANINQLPSLSAGNIAVTLV